MEEQEQRGFDLYYAAIGLAAGIECYLLWRQLRDTGPGLLARSKVQGFLARVASPCDKCREYRLSKQRMHWHAYLHTQGKFADEEGVVHDLGADRPAD